MRIYFAAPMSSDAELAYNEEVCARLEADGHEVFLPQRDGILGLDSLYERPGIETEEDALAEIFYLDHDEIKKADLVTAIIDGMAPDEGVAVEIGLAYAYGKPIVGLKTDTRSEPINPMVFSPLKSLARDPEELADAVSDYDPT